jgi:hypothetical protein
MSTLAIGFLSAVCHSPSNQRFTKFSVHLAFGSLVAIPIPLGKPKMFRISIVDTLGQRRVVLEGKLVPPWTAELEGECAKATEELGGRKLIVDLTNVTLIGPDGESILLKLMKDGAKFSSGDVLTTHVLKELALRCRNQREELGK